MADKQATMSRQFTLVLNEEEREHLMKFLEQSLPEILVEVHRTEAPDFREFVERKEAALRSLLEKLRRL